MIIFLVLLWYFLKLVQICWMFVYSKHAKLNFHFLIVYYYACAFGVIVGFWTNRTGWIRKLWVEDLCFIQRNVCVLTSQKQIGLCIV